MSASLRPDTVEILKDSDLISSLLAQSSEHEFSDHHRALFLYCNGCVFPCADLGDVISIHMFAPDSLRGSEAIAAARMVVEWAKERYKHVRCKTAINERHVGLFARWCGGKLYKTNDRYNYYEA